mmetsp:Transcript_16762/g.46184  ORF Transcript_16762/g.46184 Transcript_16762/m.46184 type:complete len:93 (+) Transcript_16762:1540-1818(+)
MSSRTKVAVHCPVEPGSAENHVSTNAPPMPFLFPNTQIQQSAFRWILHAKHFAAQMSPFRLPITEAHTLIFSVPMSGNLASLEATLLQLWLT